MNTNADESAQFSQGGQNRQSRTSAVDREAVARQLAYAASKGRLDSEELGRRLPRAHQADTYAELEQLLADLPGSEEPQERTVPEHTVPETLHVTASLRDARREGLWTVPRHIVASAGMGAVVLDFTEAETPHDEVKVDARPNVGNVEMIVREGCTVTGEETAPGSEPVHDRTEWGGGEARNGLRRLHVVANPGMGSIIVRNAKHGFLRR